jgi:hypothetical protein
MGGMPTDYRNTIKSRWIAGIAGMLVGQAIWATAAFVFAPQDSLVFGAFVAPVGLLSFIAWGDAAPPHWLWWLESRDFHIAFGLCFYGLLGAIVGLLINRRRFSLRALLIVTTLVAVGLGMFVWAARRF